MDVLVNPMKYSSLMTESTLRMCVYVLHLSTSTTSSSVYVFPNLPIIPQKKKKDTPLLLRKLFPKQVIENPAMGMDNPERGCDDANFFLPCLSNFLAQPRREEQG